MLLAGRHALITGGAGRLGMAIARTFLREGAAVAIVDVDGDRLERAADGLSSAGGSFVALSGNTAVAADVARMADEAEAAIGRLDTLVTCAAVYPNAPLLDMDPGTWDEVFAVNVRGVMLVCGELGRRWRARGSAGAIVNVSSAAARSPRRGAAAYCGSKAALESLTQVLALELGGHGIRVNAVAPGLVMDEVATGIRSGLPDYVNEMLRATPLGRTGAPDDIADAVAFLASERSAWTSGAVLDVTGGSHCGRSHLDFTPTAFVLHASDPVSASGEYASAPASCESRSDPSPRA